MADRTVSVTLLAKVSGFVQGMRTASKSAGDFGDKITGGVMKHRQSLNDLAAGTGLLGAAMVGAAGFAVKAFADFDKAMSSVRAATHASAADMDLLREAALEAGARTVFSATEAAGAIEALGKAGIGTEDILSGGLNGALDLAAAGELAVGEAAEIAATAITQFNLKGKDLPHVADLLAAAAGKAQGEVRDMGLALSYVGPVAAAMGVSIEETAGSIAFLSSQGILGEKAGTALRGILTGLTSPSAKASELMKELGINMYNANGNFVGMAGLAGQLQEKLSGLTDAQRNAALGVLFGNEQITAARILYKGGAGAIQEWTNNVNDSGYAAETAAMKLDNLSGDIEAFMGSLETALIGVGEGADGPLRDLVQSATDAVNAFSELPDATKSALLGLVGGGGLVLLGVAGLAKLAVGISETKSALSDLGLTGKRAAGMLKFAGVVGVMLALGQAASEVGEHFAGMNQDVTDVANSMEGFATTGQFVGEAAKIVENDLNGLDLALKQLGNPSGLQQFENFGDKYLYPLRGNLDLSRITVEKLDQSLMELANSGGAADAAAAFEEITRRAEEQGVPLERLRELFPEYTASMRSASGAQEEAAASAGELAEGAAQVDEALSPAEQALEDMDAQAKNLIDSLELLNTTMGVQDAQSNYEQAIDDVTARLAEYKKEVKEGEAGTKGMKGAMDLGAQAGRDNAEVLRGLWKNTSDYATETLRVTGNQKAANSILAAGRGQLVTMATQFGLTKAQAEKYVTEVLGIPKGASTLITQPGMPKAKTDADALANKVKNVPNKKNISVGTPGISGATARIQDVADAARGIPRNITVSVGVSVSGANKLQDLRRASGGPVWPNETFLVGENGPELFSPDSRGMITSAPKTAQMFQKMSTTNIIGSGPAQESGGVFEGTLVLDSGQLMGTIRGVISQTNKETKRAVMAGAGRNR